MAELYPDLKKHLMILHDHIVDLMAPFRQKLYYTKAMRGLYSIKYILTALFPQGSELDYGNLESLHNGAEASAAFSNMSNQSKKETEKVRQDFTEILPI